MAASSRLYFIGGFLLTFCTAFMVVTNYSSYGNPAEVMILKESILNATQDYNAKYGDKESENIYASFQEDVITYMTETRYRNSSLLKTIGSVIALLGSVLIRRKMRLGIHLFIGGMLFAILGCFYWHGLGITGWSLTISPIIFTGVVGVFMYKKRRSFI